MFALFDTSKVRSIASAHTKNEEANQRAKKRKGHQSTQANAQANATALPSLQEELSRFKQIVRGMPSTVPAISTKSCSLLKKGSSSEGWRVLEPLHTKPPLHDNAKSLMRKDSKSRKASCSRKREAMQKKQKRSTS